MIPEVRARSGYLVITTPTGVSRQRRSPGAWTPAAVLLAAGSDTSKERRGPVEYGHWQRYEQPQPTVLLVPTLVDHPLPAVGSESDASKGLRRGVMLGRPGGAGEWVSCWGQEQLWVELAEAPAGG